MDGDPTHRMCLCMPEREGKVLQWFKERNMVVIESLGTGQVASREGRMCYGRNPKDRLPSCVGCAKASEKRQPENEEET